MNLQELISQTERLEGSGRYLKGVNHDSLVVDTEKQMFFWNSKGIYGDKFQWLTKVLGRSTNQALEFIKQASDNVSITVTLEKDTVSTIYPKLVDVFHENLLLEGDNRYFESRGISKSTISRFSLGRYKDFVTIPIFMDGQLKNFQLRKDNPKTIRSYYRTGMRSLFNADILKVTNNIIIVEGLTGALRTLQEGVACVAGSAGAEGWDTGWAKYFLHQKNIYIVYDNDSAGRFGAKKVAENLGLYLCKIYTFPGKREKYDIADYFNDGHTGNELMDLLHNEARFSHES